MKERIRVLIKPRVKRMSGGIFKTRVRSLLIVFLIGLFVINLGRVGWIMVVNGEEYRSKAAQQQLYDTELEAMRGTIYDCNMTPLVTSTSAWILCCNPKEIYGAFGEKRVDEYDKFCKALAEDLSKIIGTKAEDTLELLKKKDSKYERIKKKVSASMRSKIEKCLKKERGYKIMVEAKHFWQEDKEKDVSVKAENFFYYENDNIRSYPNNNFASKVIGVVNADNHGETGIESWYDEVLSGEKGRIVTAKDSNQNILETSYETYFDAVEGNGIVLTIDSKIQSYLENALSKALIDTGAKGTFGIVMDVDTGAILAMSDKPDFDLNNPRVLNSNAAKAELKKFTEGTLKYQTKYAELLHKQWNSFCVTSNYEPGSTFKIFTAAAAIEENIIDYDSYTYNCESLVKVADKEYHCANNKAHGIQSATQGLMHSCNTFFITLGQKMGVDTYYKYFEAFGFTERTGIDLNNEAMSVVHSQDKMSIVDLASTSFGQSIRISPIQLLTATCAIANGGKLMVPYLVESVVDSEQNIVSQTEPTVKRQVISEGTSQKLCQMMRNVVEGGQGSTGSNAYIEGYRVAGKTATSEKLDLKKDKNGERKKVYTASFVCFAPADDPQVAVLVGVDEPAGEYRSGGVIAAPIAKEVLTPTLEYLNVEPRYTAAELKNISSTAPDLVGKSINQAKIAAANEGYVTRVVGGGKTVVAQVPASEQIIPKNGVIVLYTEKGAATQKVKVPSFMGMTIAQVNKAANAAGLNVTFSTPTDTTGVKAYTQSIAKGAVVEAGSNITVGFRNNDIVEN